ncbi:hypothetical protein RRG08_055037 [Elysia crispata]|uniref:Uncharacterized protein n=1 Tax=Elysia crispata TaxID=231223 RepID=A0AAE0XT77_9GAST|nr:hypothetical protein RRG08_055037 [Elysia crispata]
MRSDRGSDVTDVVISTQGIPQALLYSGYQHTGYSASFTLQWLCLGDTFRSLGGMDNSPSAAGRDLCENSANFRCDPEGSQCVFANATCDGISHCANGRDESVETCGCLPSEFQCNQTTCISKLKQCDTFRDCSDGLDEQNCESYSCYESSFFAATTIFASLSTSISVISHEATAVMLR